MSYRSTNTALFERSLYLLKVDKRKPSSEALTEIVYTAILILGGTGHCGRYIVLSLLEKGTLVKVLSRNEDSSRKVSGEGPEIIDGDITSEKSIIEALNGVRAGIMTPG